MNYLFFDIECSNGHNICSFGYVLTDKEFNILEKKDIVMNSKADFNLGGRIELAYSEDYFRSKPSFDYYYYDIKTLLENDNQTVLGHSLDSDITYLSIACKKFNKPMLKFNYYDTQKFFKVFAGDSRIKNLEGIIKNLNIDKSHLKEHKSDDDAELSMLTLKEVCKHMECNVDDLINLSKQKPVNSFYYEFGEGRKSLKKFLSIIYDNYDTYNENKNLTKVCFDEHLDTVNIQHVFYIINELKKQNVYYTDKASVCDVFVTSGKNSIRYLPAIEHAEEQDRKLKILTFEEFLKEYYIDLKIFKEVKIARDSIKKHSKRMPIKIKPQEYVVQSKNYSFALALEKAKERELRKENKRS
jgi:DNA-binding Xre family transcriptional regulator